MPADTASVSSTTARPSRAERDATRRRRLMRTALELFTARGYHNTPIETLCRESGVTTRYFYQLFGSREALLRALHDDIIGEVLAETASAVAAVEVPDPMQRLRVGLKTFLHSYLDDPRRAELACLQVVGISPEFERHRRASLERFAALLQAQASALVAAGTIPGPINEKLALALVGATNELILDWLHARPRPSVESLYDNVLEVYTLTLAGLSARAGR